jgi:Zn-dependent protease
MEITYLAASIILFILTVLIHEIAHGWVADKLGDPTARLSGRLTLNPLPHIDLYGSVLLPLFLILVRSPFMFGWAKPVPIDPYNLKNPKKDSAAIALAGPMANIAVATILAIVYRFIVLQTFSGLILEIIVFNVSLAVFNLLPIHPLDGEKILVGFLPNKEAQEYDTFMGRYGLIILVLGMFFPIIGGQSLLSVIIYPIIKVVLNLLIPGFGTI